MERTTGVSNIIWGVWCGDMRAVGVLFLSFVAIIVCFPFRYSGSAVGSLLPKFPNGLAASAVAGLLQL